MAFAEDYNLVEAFASDGANQPLGIPVLPRRSWSNRSIANAHASQALNEDPSVGRVPVPDQVGGGVFPRKRFCKLMCDPFSGRIGGHVHPDQTSPIEPENNQPEQELESDRWNRE